MSIAKKQGERPAPKSVGGGASKGANWGAKLLLDKTCEVLRAGAAPQSQTIGNALAIASSHELDLERLAQASAPLPEAWRRPVREAMEKAKFPGVSWESVIEPLLTAVWREKRRPAPSAKAPGRSPPSQKRSSEKVSPARGEGKAGSRAPAAPPSAPVIVRRASKLSNRPG